MRNSLCSACLVIRDKFFDMCSSVLPFKHFSLLPTCCLLRFISFSFNCSLILPTMLFKASSNDAPFSTSGVTSGGVTLSIPGSFLLVKILALILCLDVFPLSTSGSADALPSPMFLFSQVRLSEFVLLTKSLDWPDVFVSFLIVLTTPNLSMFPVSLLVYGSFSWVEPLRLT